MLKTIALASIILLTTGIAISQDRWGKTVIDSSILNYVGDTVFIYEPGYVVKIGNRLMSLDGVEAEMHAYKILYAHCDSLVKLKDSTSMAKDSAFYRYEEKIKEKEVTNDILRRLIKEKENDNIMLSEMYTIEKRKGKRQKYIWGFSGGAAGVVGGILLTAIIVR